MSRRVRTKINVRAKGSRLHHSIGKTDNVKGLKLFERVEVMRNIMPFYENGALNFSGSAEEFRNMFQVLASEDKDSIKTLTISIKGDLIQQENTKCIITVFILGVLLIFPMLLFLTNWFKKSYKQLFESNISVYQLLQNVLNSCPYSEQAHLFIQDNHVNKNKLQCLFDSKLPPTITIINMSSGFKTFIDFFQTFQSPGTKIQGLWGKAKVSHKIQPNGYDICDSVSTFD